MDFYTTVLRKSGQYWVALCLENGIVGQGATKDFSKSYASNYWILLVVTSYKRQNKPNFTQLAMNLGWVVNGGYPRLKLRVSRR